MFQLPPKSCLLPTFFALLVACSGDPSPGASGGGASTGGTTTGSGGQHDNQSGTGGGSTEGGTAAGGNATGGGGMTGGGGGNPSTPSEGCGSQTLPESGTFTIDVDGLEREYILTLPDDYDPNRAYPIIFGWHPLGGSAQGVANPAGFGTGGYYGLLGRADGSVIFVAGDGLPNDEGSKGWPNTNNRDVLFLEAMLDRFRGELCIDESRVLSTGFSFGGMMSMTIGCRLGQTFRAMAPMAGSLLGGYGSCVSEPVAAMIIHGTQDGVNSFGVPVEGSRAFRDYLIGTNGCGNASAPADPSPCVAYNDCNADYPLTYCEFEGEHTIPSFASAAIWDFFSQFL